MPPVSFIVLSASYMDIDSIVYGRERTDDTGIKSKRKRAHTTGRDQIYGSEEAQLAAHRVGKYVCTEYKKKKETQCAMIALYTRPPRITPPPATYGRAADLIRDGRGIL